MQGRDIRGFIAEHESVQGPTCGDCEPFIADRLKNGEGPMLTSPYGGNKYESPHAATYRTEARMAQVSCRVGVHGQRVTFPY